MIPGPFHCCYMGKISHQPLGKAKACPAWPGTSMAQKDDKPQPHGPHSSAWGKSQGGRVQAPNGLAPTLVPSAVSITVEMKGTNSKDCKQGGWLFLMQVFSLQQGRSPKAVWIVCNHQKRWHWKYPSFMLPVWVTSCKIMIASDFLFPLSMTSCNSCQKQYNPSHSQSLFHIV